MEAPKIKFYRKYGITWYGTVSNLESKEADETIAPHVLLFIVNRKGMHYVALELEKVDLESGEVGPFRSGQKITILEYWGEIIQIRDGHGENGQILFESWAGERPWGYRLKHDILDPSCTWHRCTYWEHWYQMSTTARNEFLEAGNRGWYIDDRGKERWHPPIIFGGFLNWEPVSIDET